MSTIAGGQCKVCMWLVISSSECGALPSVQGTSELEPGLSALNAVVYFCQDKRHFHKSSAALSTHHTYSCR